MVFIFRARFLAEFTLSGQNEILRFAQNDSVRAWNDTLLEREPAAILSGRCLKGLPESKWLKY